MSETVYRAIKEDLEAVTKAVREECHKETDEARRETEKIRREFEEWRHGVAIGLLNSGVDANIVCTALGYTLDELMDLMDSEIS